MKIKNSNIILINIILLMCIILFFITTILFILNSMYIISFKDARNYTLSDLANAQMINLDVKSASSNDWGKCDINMDGAIDNTDVHIIQQMLLGYYDYYVVCK